MQRTAVSSETIGDDAMDMSISAGVAGMRCVAARGFQVEIAGSAYPQSWE